MSMSDLDGNLALRIVDETRQIADRLGITSEHSQRHVMECTRLASLNWLYRRTYGHRNAVDELFFRRLTFFGEKLGLDQSRVVDDVRQLLEAFRSSSLMEELGRSPCYSPTSLMLKLHSIGAFRPISHSMVQKRRRILGSYFTPMPLAQHIVGITLGPWLEERNLRESSSAWERAARDFTLIDPACGPGAFLLSAVDYLSSQLKRKCDRTNYRRNLSLFVDGLYGVELDGASVEVAHRVLNHRLTELGLEKPIPSSHIIQGDSLIGFLREQSGAPKEYLSSPSINEFNWNERFECEMLEQGGFRFVVMNPPYDRLHPSRAEYIRERLSQGEREVDMEGFEAYKTELKQRVEYFRNSGEYSLANKYTLDTHRLFIERALRISRSDARLGFIVPASVLGDLSAAALREEILTKHSIYRLEEYQEGSSLFPNVTQALCIMSVKKGSPSGIIPAAFGLRHLHSRSKLRLESISVQRIENLSGSEYIIPRLKSQDWQILDIIHKHASLNRHDWVRICRGELDLTLDKNLISADNDKPPLLRGSHIRRFVHTSSIEIEDFVDYDAFKEKHSTSERIAHSERERIACQQVSNRKQRWRLKFALVEPHVVLANSCNYLTLTCCGSRPLLLYLLGVLNSSLLNWRFDITNTNNHVSNRELGHLPIPSPFDLTPEAEHLYDAIVKDVGAILNGDTDCSHRLEGHVFQLYEIPSAQARIVLSHLAAEEREVEAIVRGMDEAM